MATLYMREFGFRASLSDEEALVDLRFMVDELLPAIQGSEGIRSAKLFSGAGGLRSQLRLFVEMDHSAGYERMLLNPQIRKHLKKLYAAWDLTTATQDFLREVTPDLISAHASSD